MRRQKGEPAEAEWLESRGFDGLYHPDPTMECGCYLSDLRPCGERDTPCRGGRTRDDRSGVFQPVSLPRGGSK